MQDVSVNYNKRVIFDADFCKGCQLCVSVCPRDIIRMSAEINSQGYHFAVVDDGDQDRCTSCAFCAWLCPDLAVRVFRSPRGGKK